METKNPRTSAVPPDGVPGDDGSARPPHLADWRASLRLAERACCCPSRPAVVVIVPPGPGRASPSELFLCRHHYVASERALASAAAAVFDPAGAADPTRAVGVC